jgi:hypothetical protein
LTGLELRILVKAIALPPSGLLRVGVVGLLCWRRRPRLGLALCAASIGGLWLLATPVFSDVLARAGEGYPALDPKHLTAAQARAQAIVILGQCPRGRRHAPLRGGELAARRALGRGSLEAASSDTHENAVFSARLLRPPSPSSHRQRFSGGLDLHQQILAAHVRLQIDDRRGGIEARR